jgi:tetratricopeptide (TPR) repeat protein
MASLDSKTLQYMGLKLWLAALVIAAPDSFGHEGPEHEIAELTDRLLKEGPSAQLLLERAVEYQILRQYPEAVKDLERAARIEPQSAPILRELGRVYFTTGKTNEALETVTRGLETSVRGAERASLLVTRAEVLRARQDFTRALKDANEAIEEHPGNVEWYLLRSQLQAQLKLRADRVKDLDEAIEKTGSGMLQIEWIDALIDNEQYPLALEKIENELKASRLRSTWLIRRARVLLATARADAAKADLRAAIGELNDRLNPSAPDPSLLADRGLAYELLGDKEKARKDYTAARDKGLVDDWLQSHIRALGGDDDKSKDTTKRRGSR